MNMLIRLARPADAVALPAIERSAAELFRRDPSLAWLADAEVPDVAQHLLAIQHKHVWVAENTEGQLAGFLRAVQIDGQLHIEELSVSQGFQGQGIGRALVTAAIEKARQQQLQAVTLTTFRDLPWNAPFYQRMGFIELPPAHTFGHLQDALQSEIAHHFPAERRCAMHLPTNPL
ncbi:Predicted N-acetyltransferase YhbS [Pseudomonas helmanticensis]|uniref:Predicted N-acetyltransferase YhbS n=1 Tax=Pseudomonas helmanticensis TaxID=1471381 RepID=A0ACD2U1L3_9PSED|nr:GNAT family N-acetyltransferase [Pseudomonas helmanticensis]SMQ23579.1 Predicted N-acetyltransferase YhbS [Pseudomonas helmanticensis]